MDRVPGEATPLTVRKSPTLYALAIALAGLMCLLSLLGSVYFGLEGAGGSGLVLLLVPLGGAFGYFTVLLVQALQQGDRLVIGPTSINLVRGADELLCSVPLDNVERVVIDTQQNFEMIGLKLIDPQRPDVLCPALRRYPEQHRARGYDVLLGGGYRLSAHEIVSILRVHVRSGVRVPPMSGA